MVFNTTFNNISVILWRSLLLVEGNGVPEDKYSLTFLAIPQKKYYMVLKDRIFPNISV
jgi:hypothetical protein